MSELVEITVQIDPEQWSALLEGWGDGAIEWDAQDRDPVYERVIDPIDQALEMRDARAR